jgi:hypothetical protein
MRAGRREWIGLAVISDSEIEVRRLFELDDFAPSKSVERFRELDLVSKK